MQKRGLTAAGKQRWLCVICNRSGIRKREDNRIRSRLFLFSKWIVGSAHLADAAKSCRVSVRTMSRRFEPFRNAYSKPSKDSADILVLDATSIKKRELVMLVAGDGRIGGAVSWAPAIRECFDSWADFLMRLKKDGVSPRAVVCDGQKGLLKAVCLVWPGVIVQRCIIHVKRLAFAWLTQNPKTEAGRELRRIVAAISEAENEEGVNAWLASFASWRVRHENFLKERTAGQGRHWWYTHRKLRAVRSLLANAAPDLFRNISDPKIPRTTNFVEGGINNRLKDLFRTHRGISFEKKLVLASRYLKSRQDKKPPRNVY